MSDSDCQIDEQKDQNLKEKTNKKRKNEFLEK